jgi:hypothetical protein
MATRKAVRSPQIRVMLQIASNIYEWRSPKGLVWKDLELCGVQVFTDFDSGCSYVPLLF